MRRATREVSILSMLCAFLPAVLAAQEVDRLPAAESTDELVALVEAEGRSYPSRKAEAASDPFAAFEWVGSSDRECVEVTSLQPTRSGEFVIGGQIAEGQLVHERENKIWWAPLNNALDMPPLLVRGVRLDPRGDRIGWESSRIAWPPARRAGSSGDPTRNFFFPSWFTPPSAGRWLVVATSGDNWGCFILNVE